MSGLWSPPTGRRKLGFLRQLCSSSGAQWNDADLVPGPEEGALYPWGGGWEEALSACLGRRGVCQAREGQSRPEAAASLQVEDAGFCLLPCPLASITTDTEQVPGTLLSAAPEQSGYCLSLEDHRSPWIPRPILV